MTDHSPPPGEHLDGELLSAIADGAASEAERGDAAEHLAACGACADRLAELAATIALVAAPVAPLSDDVKEAQLQRALAAFTAGDDADQAVPKQPQEPPAPAVIRPLPDARRRNGRLPAPLVAVASVALLVVLGLGAIKLLSGGNSSTPDSASGTTSVATTPANSGGTTHAGASIQAQLRRIVGTADSCAAFDVEDEDSSAVAPDVVLTPRPPSTCVVVGPPIAFFGNETTVAVSGAGGLRGSDTVTLHSSRPVTTWPTGAATTTPQLALLADGAVVGLVHSIVVAPGTLDATIVVTGVPPAVAEYLQTLFAPA